MKTTLPKEKDIVRKWYVIDATDRPIGRLAVRVANVLRGKIKPDFAPHIDMGDFVVVINAAKSKLTGTKEEKKVYDQYTGFVGGLKRTPAAKMRERHPEYMIMHAVKDMLPKNKLSRQSMRRLKIYAGAEHPHEAQRPQVMEL